MRVGMGMRMPVVLVVVRMNVFMAVVVSMVVFMTVLHLVDLDVFTGTATAIVTHGILLASG
jgi:hypothetical protein